MRIQHKHTPLTKCRILFPIAFATVLVSGCGTEEKNAQYFYNHPEELEPAMEGCILKIQETPDEKLDSLRDDKLCNAVVTAATGIELGDLKKAQLHSSKYNFSIFIDDAKEKRAEEAKALDELAKIEELAKTDPNKASNLIYFNSDFIRCVEADLKKRDWPHWDEICDRAKKLYIED